MTGSRPSLTVFFPCCNDASTIRGLVIRADEVASRLADTYEILVVDDGSTDDSLERLSALRREVASLRIIEHPENLGYGGALKSGFREASGDLVFYTDGDGQYDVRELASMASLLRDDIDAVNGYKVRRSDAWYRVVSGRLYGWIMRLVFRFKIRDVDCDFRLIRRRALDDICLEFNSGMITVELVAKLERAGCRFAEMPVGHYPRRFGRSQFFRPSRVGRTLLDSVALWCELRRAPGVRCPGGSPTDGCEDDRRIGNRVDGRDR